MTPHAKELLLPRGSRRALRAWLGCIAAVWVLLLAVAGCRQHTLPTNRLPPVVAEIEEAAEDIFDLTATSNWERAAQRTRLLREATARLEAARRQTLPELERAVSDLDRAVESHDVLRSGRAANEVMRQSVHLGADHLGQDSAAVLMLDVETREILVDADVDPQAADAAVSRARVLWSGLRPEVEQRGGRTLADRCDSHLRQLETGSAAIRRAEAQALLETLDRLEEIFS